MLTIVGGHPRSGTTSLKAILNRHPEIYCTSELPIRWTYRTLIDFLQKTHAQAEKREDSKQFAQRVERMTAELWFGLSKFREQRKAFEAAKLWANKTPGSEAYFRQYAKVLPSVNFIYCLHDPVKVLRSNMNMVWGQGRSFDEQLQKLHVGYRHFLDAMPELSERTFVFSIGAWVANKTGETKALCDFLGVGSSDAIVQQMADTPPANTSDQTRQVISEARELTAAEIERLSENPTVTELFDWVERTHPGRFWPRPNAAKTRSPASA